MSLVSLRDVGVAFGAETVLAGVTFRIETRDRIAVVGANGSGKTTLLTLISGAREATAGEVEWQRGLRIGYLPQDAPEPVAETILDEVMASREDLAAMHREMTALEPMLADSARPDAAKLLERYGDVQHRYIDQGGYELEANAREALGGLGIDTETQQRHPSQLSGGQKRRLELAKLLVQDADLLLIDEPTNHLDLTAIEWLEDFMRGVSTAFVLVSHDRRFLDNVCTQVIEVTGGAVEDYPGELHAVHEAPRRAARAAAARVRRAEGVHRPSGGVHPQVQGGAACARGTRPADPARPSGARRAADGRSQAEAAFQQRAGVAGDAQGRRTRDRPRRAAAHGAAADHRSR